MFDWSDWVGRPWRDRGRGQGGFDCWGLVVAAFEAGTGVALPAYADGYSSAADRAETAAIFAGEVGGWSEVPADRAMPYDAMVVSNGRRLHVGLVVRRGLVLHQPFNQTSRLEPVSRFADPHFFRHRSLGGMIDGTGQVSAPR
jgi:cell wall-associated NlpC family hydrolase